MGKLSVNLCGIELSNPVIPASGTFGYGYEFAELYDINELGTFSFKGTTKDPRFGNPTPRIAECTSGMINAVGLQNPGVEKVISEELPTLKQIRTYCLRQVDTLWDEVKRFDNPHTYYVDLSQKLWDIKYGLLKSNAK